MAASVWTGYLTIGLISMPVRLFSGARGERVSFHMLHRTDNVRVKQQLICPEEDVVVDRSEIVKGYEYRKGEYVIIEPEEIKKIEPKTAKAMEILEFVKADEVDPIYFETSYYLMPEEAGRRPYALLAKALDRVAPKTKIVASGNALLSSPAWAQMIADVLGRRIELSASNEVSSRGAALLALEAAGKIDSVETIDFELAPIAYEPDMTRHLRYAEAIERQQKLYEKLI